MVLVFSIVMMMNAAVNGEAEGERNAEERTAAERATVREDERNKSKRRIASIYEEAVCARTVRRRGPATVPRVCIHATAALLQPAHARVYNAP